MAEPEDVKEKDKPANVSDKTEGSISKKTRDTWDLKGSVIKCIRRYADQLTSEELDVILQSMQDGLSGRQIKRILILPDQKAMDSYRKIFLYGNRTK